MWKPDGIIFARALSATEKFNSLLSCSQSRMKTHGIAPATTPGMIVSGAYSRRRGPKTTVEQALMRGLDTA
jgi:hypothetical protein